MILMRDRKKITAIRKEVLLDAWNTFVHCSAHSNGGSNEHGDMIFPDRIFPKLTTNNCIRLRLENTNFERLSLDKSRKDIVPTGCAGMIEVNA